MSKCTCKKGFYKPVTCPLHGKGSLVEPSYEPGVMSVDLSAYSGVDDVGEFIAVKDSLRDSITKHYVKAMDEAILRGMSDTALDNLINQLAEEKQRRLNE